MKHQFIFFVALPDFTNKKILDAQLKLNFR